MRNTVKIMLLVLLGYVASTSIFSGLAISLNPDGSMLQLDSTMQLVYLILGMLIAGLSFLIRPEPEIYTI